MPADLTGNLRDTSLVGFLKHQYGGKSLIRPQNLSMLQNMIKFKKNKAPGRSFRVGVQLSRAAGTTYVGNTGGIVNINNANGFQFDEFIIESNYLATQVSIPSQDFLRAQDDKQAYGDYVKKVLIDVRYSMRNSFEQQLLHAPYGISETKVATAANAFDLTAQTADDATLLALNHTRASNELWVKIPANHYAEAYWESTKGRYMSFTYENSSGDTVLYATPGTDSLSQFLVKKVVTGARVRTDDSYIVFDLSTGAGVTPANLTVMTRQAGALGEQNTDFHYAGASPNWRQYRIVEASMNSANIVGFQGIAQSSTLYGVNLSDNQLLQPIHINAAGRLTKDLLDEFMQRLKAREMSRYTPVVLIHPYTYGDLISQYPDNTFQVKYSPKMQDVGLEDIVAHTIAGPVKFKLHNGIKPSVVIGLVDHDQEDVMCRVGNKDLGQSSFFPEDISGVGNWIRESGTTGNYQQFDAEQTLFVACPNKVVVMTGITLT